MKKNSHLDVLKVKFRCSKVCQKNGQDGVIIKNLYDTAIYASGREDVSSDVVIAFESNQIKSVYNENPTEDADIRYAISIIDAERNLSNEIDNWLDGKMPKDHLFHFGDTPSVLKQLGAKQLPIVLPEDRILKFTTDYNDHPVPLDEVKKLPSEIADPIMILPGTINGKLLPNSFAIITEMVDKDGNDVLVAIHLNGMENHYLVNRIATIFGKDNYKGYLKGMVNLFEKENVGILYADKKRAKSWATSDRVQFPSLVQYIDKAPNITIPLNEKKNNYRYSLDSVNQM